MTQMNQNKKVLVVGYGSVINEALHKHLSKLGCEITFATSESVSKLNKRDVCDTVFTDEALIPISPPKFSKERILTLVNPRKNFIEKLSTRRERRFNSRKVNK